MRKFAAIIVLTLVLPVCFAAAQTPVNSFRILGPYAAPQPYAVDTVDVDGKPYDEMKALDAVPFGKLFKAPCRIIRKDAIADSTVANVYFLGFSLQSPDFTVADVKVEGLSKMQFYVDGKQSSGSALKLEPGTHEFAIAALATPKEVQSLKVAFKETKGGKLILREDGRHLYSLEYNSKGMNCGGVDISPSGKYAVLCYALTKEDGKTDRTYDVIRLSDGQVLKTSENALQWLSGSDSYYFTEKEISSSRLVCADIETGRKTVLAENIPDYPFEISPNCDYAICSVYKEGPKEGDVHQIVSPEDRQPGWRGRTSLAKFDFATGTLQPLTFGFHNSWLADISGDGKRILFMTNSDKLTERPSAVFSVYEMNLESGETRCLIKDDGFISAVAYSPDGKQISIIGAAEALGNVGNAVPEGRIPNGYDFQLFLMNLSDLSVIPLTKDFNPSVSTVLWSKFDGKLYFTAEDKDCVNFFRADPASGKIERLDSREENVSDFALAEQSAAALYYGQSLCNSHRAYLLNTRNGKQQLLHDFNADKLDGVDLGEGFAYEFTSSRGDVINGFYVLPVDFDPQKKYPLIVHYYGGCSPSARACNGSYSPHLYAAQGYVFYVVNPSGAAGFGQEFASRHVNTAGDGVAEDIIEATQNFCKDHPYVDADRIGCFSASYGGFMTQLLLTRTDIYACGISHAGISDHTSYWGEGYWGYTYSQISMSDSFPWTRKDLYVDRSPLYNADKIHTPILFLHGSADTNVPIGESIQMYTALKVLGAEAEFVVVDGENHGIRDYEKRRQWLRTKFAWFAKYLKGDDTWWNELYPPKNL